jgi:hypothetical protein
VVTKTFELMTSISPIGTFGSIASLLAAVNREAIEQYCTAMAAVNREAIEQYCTAMAAVNREAIEQYCTAMAAVNRI